MFILDFLKLVNFKAFKMSVKFGKGLYYKTDLRSYRNLYYHELMRVALYKNQTSLG